MIHVSLSHQRVHVALSVVWGITLSTSGGGGLFSPMHGVQSGVTQNHGTPIAPHSPVTLLGHCTRAQWWDHRIFPGVMVHPPAAVWLKGAKDSGLDRWRSHTPHCAALEIHQPLHLKCWEHSRLPPGSDPASSIHRKFNVWELSPSFFQENKVCQANTGTNGECCSPVLPLQP